jgi:hypothetical protein
MKSPGAIGIRKSTPDIIMTATPAVEAPLGTVGVKLKRLCDHSIASPKYEDRAGRTGA